MQAAPRPEQSFKDLFDALAAQLERVLRGKRRADPPLARVPLLRGSPADRGRARRRQDVAGQGDRRVRSAARGGACSSPPTSFPPTSPASRCGTAAATTSSSARAACSRTSCSPTRSTARRPRPNRRCSKRWRSARSRSTRTPTGCRDRSSSSRRRTRSSSKAPIRCPRPSSTASCCGCASAIPIAKPSSRSSTRKASTR